MTPLEKLQARWFRKTGEQMPEAIARLSIGRILTAVELTEDGQTVFVPSCPVTVPENKDGYGYGESMREWDCESNF